MNLNCIVVLLPFLVVAASAASVTLEPLVLRKIGGVSELSRIKWFTVHEEPFNSMEWRPQDTQQFGQNGYNSNLGRGFTISGAMQKSEYDDVRTEYVNTSSLIKFCAATCPAGPDNPTTPKRCRTSGWNMTHNVDFVYSSKPDNFFETGCAKIPKKKPGFVPPTPDAAADFFSQYFRYCLLPNAAETPRAIIEVMNEVEAHLGDCTGGVWGPPGAMQVVDINVAIAKRLHEDYGSPGTPKSANQPAALVAGPVGAHPEFQSDNYKPWKRFYSIFLENAGPHLDALAMHYYDTHLRGGSTDADSADYLVRSGSNLEAVLDLQEAYALATLNKVLPQLVSEYGSGFKVKGIKYSPVHDWWVLRGVNAKMMQLMNRPDRVVKAIPFIVGKAIWHVKIDGPTANDSSTTPYPFVLWRNTKRQVDGKNKPSDTWSETHLHKFYQMWAELPDGAERFAVGSDDANIQVQGFRAANDDTESQRTIFVAINSLRPWKAGDTPTVIDLSWLVENTSFEPDVSFRRLFFDRATRTPKLTMTTLSAVPDRISLKPEELVLLKLVLTPRAPTEFEWYNQVENVSTYQSTRTVSKLNYTRPEKGLPFSTLPQNVSGMLTARISLGGQNKSLAAALASLHVEISGNACGVFPKLQIPGETRVNPNDGSFMGAIEIDCGTANGSTPIDLRVWSTRMQVDDGLMLSSAVLVVKTRSTDPQSVVPSPSTMSPASSTQPSPVTHSPSSVPSASTLSPASSAQPSPVTFSPSSSASQIVHSPSSMVSPTVPVPASSNSKLPSNLPSGDAKADSDSKKSKPDQSLEDDSGGVIIALILSALFFVAIIVGGFVYWKYSQNKDGHNLLQETGIQFQNVTRNPLEQETADTKKLVWKTHETEEGHKYYEDSKTGRTTWTARDSLGHTA